MLVVSKKYLFLWVYNLADTQKNENRSSDTLDMGPRCTRIQYLPKQRS